MSDHPQDAGWWRATDGRWYPPHLHPHYAELRQEVAATHPLDDVVQPERPPAQGPPGTPLEPATPRSATTMENVVPPTVRTIGSNSMGWTWFSPPAAIALFASAAAAVLGVLAPGSVVSFFLVGVAAVWTVRTVVRVRAGYGAEVMSVVAVAVAAVACLACCAALALSFSRPTRMPGMTETPPLPADEVPDDDEEIAWYELRAPWCFDVVDPGMEGEWIRTVVVRDCTAPHDAQAIAVERGDTVQQRAIDALLAATFADPGSTSTPPAGRSAADESVDPIEGSMFELCDELAGSQLVDPLPEGLMNVPVYPAAMQTAVDPAVVCVLVDSGGGVLTRSFVD